MWQLIVLLLSALFGLQADPCPAALPIAEARTKPLGTQVTVFGQVTVPTGVFTTDQSFALQDATAGIYVFRQAGIGQELALGDQVCVSGRLSSYHGMLELLPGSPAQVIRVGPGQPPAARVVKPYEIGEETEGLLISVTGRFSGAGHRRFRVGTATIYLDAATGITTEALVEGQTVTVTGLSADYDGAQVWPRFPQDIEVAQASGWPTPTPRAPLTIAQIQGPDSISPYDGRTGLGPVAGCVTGVAADGFFLQSVTPDDDPRTSEGLFVFRYTGWDNPRGLRPGDLLEITSFEVQEYYGSTEIVGLADDSQATYRRLGPCQLPAPIPISPLTDPAADPEQLYEPYEGMRVALSLDGMVVGPTVRYPSRFPSGEPEIALVERHSPFFGQRIFAGQLPAGRGLVHLSGGLGADLPDVGFGDRLRADGLTGVLAYQFGRYILLVDPGQSARLSVEDVPDPSDPEPPLAADEFALCTFNLENLFDPVDDGDGDMGDWAPADEAAFAAQLARRARALREALQGCPVVGVQEVEGKDAVWERLSAAVGPQFRYDYYESADERDITVGILYDSQRVTLHRSEQAQACSPTDYGVDYVWAVGPRARPNPCAAGTYPLFDRPPYVADLTIRSGDSSQALDVRIVVNHLKSKRGDETVNLPWRVEQARHVASLLSTPYAVALGDFNDGLGSATLAQFAGFVNLYTAHLAPRDRYTYIYQGVSEALDHFIMTAGLDRHYKSGGPVHINADFPEPSQPDSTFHRSSDHDPLFVRFSFRPTGISEATAGVVSGAVGMWWRQGP